MKKSKTLSIGWDIITQKEMKQILEEKGGYIDGDKKTVEVYVC